MGHQATEAGHGAVELFIAQFNQYESSENLFSRCTDGDGFAWWDVVRYSIQFAICAERGIYAHAKPIKPRLLARLRSFTRQSALLLRDFARLATMDASGIERLYVFGRRCDLMLDEMERSMVPCLVAGDAGAASSSHLAVNKNSFDFFVRVASRFVRIPDSVSTASAAVNQEIQAKFGTRVDVDGIIRRKYAQHRAGGVAWRFLLSRLGALKTLGFVNDDTLRTLVALANARGVCTREFQHGYMGRSHINYSYPPLPVPLATLPAEVVVHRDSGDISYPVNVIRPQPTGLSHAGSLDAARDIDVLVGGSPTRSTEAIAIIRALADKGLSLAVKLHPSQSESSSGIRDYFTPAQIAVHSSQSDFVSLVRRAKVYVPANPTSTTSFEAVENGARLVIVDYGGVKMTSVLDTIVSARVESYADLHGAVLPLLRHTEPAALC